MKFFLFFCFWIPLLTVNSQVSSFYGIDMKKDWYSLTDLSKMSYEIYSHEYPDAPYVSVPPSKAHSLVEFNKLGLSKVQLHFERNNNSDFHFFKPSMCSASKVYNDDATFNTVGQKDYSNVKSDLIQKYGQPTQNVNGTVAKTSYWNSTNYEVVLTLDLKTLELLLLYRIKD